MASSESLKTHQISSSIRFINGYRYLDRCGEALIRLEEVLEKGWIPSEPTPRGGLMKNDALGLTVKFNASAMSIQQNEFISESIFKDQACRLYDVLCSVFEIKQINVPSATVTMQRGFGDDEISQACRWVESLNLYSVHDGLVSLLGGKKEAFDFTLVTEDRLTWDESDVHQRRRMVVSVIRQERQAPFDERLLKRARTLHEKQREAMAGLMKLRRHLPEVHPVAAQFELEHSFESEFGSRTFDYPGFLEAAWQWSQEVAAGITSPNRRK